MNAGIEIKRALAGYTRISYNGEEIAKHYLSATIQGTREAFEIPEEESVISWLENKFADEIKAIEEAQENAENEVVYRLMNHDNPEQKPRFEKFTLSELNERFETNYSSVDEAVAADPEYLFTEAEMKEYLADD